MRVIELFKFLVLSYAVFLTPGFSSENIWLLIDTKNLTLEVKQGNKNIAVIENIAIGRNGAGFKKRVGDDVTPLGTFKIGWINKNSSFYRFYGFTYPSVENANEALLSGLLSKKKHTAIINAHRNSRLPPQNTTIGGRIGIHGLGKGDEDIHELMNWTQGCIALTNEQVDQLDPWITTGMVVKVK